MGNVRHNISKYTVKYNWNRVDYICAALVTNGNVGYWSLGTFQEIGLFQPWFDFNVKTYLVLINNPTTHPK